MSDPSETSDRPPPSSTRQPEAHIASLTAPQRRRRASNPSDERSRSTKATSSRRRPGARKQPTLGPNDPSSFGDSSIMQTSTSPTHMLPSVNYTRTGRISKAKKGLKVHNCECGRSYTRAEHLRRHQRNHAQEALRCDFPGCGKPFYRLDLLQRHQERHNEPSNDSPQIFSPASTAEPEMQVSTSVTLPPPIVTALSQPEQYYTQPVTPIPASTTDTSRVKSQNFPARQNSGAVPVLMDDLQTNIAWNDPFNHSPNHYSSSSDYASPIPIPHEYANMFANPPYGTGSNRTRASSNASYIEPAWAYPSRSPTSATSTMAYTWNSTEKSPAPSNLAYMTTSYPMTSMPMPAGVDPMTSFGHFGPKTMVQRDEEEQAFLFPEESYGMDQLTHTYPFEQYLNNYWRYFDPTYPIIHRATIASVTRSPMLQAAMIAIGGQYSNDASVKRKSRILHDRCMKLLDKRELDIMSEADRICDWQALFLVEVLSQYRARRAAKTLSSRFETLYNKLCESLLEVTSNIGDSVSALVQPEDSTYKRWEQWIELSTQQRLLLCCYILEYQQATFLARNSQHSLISCSGLDLPVPAHSDLWEATTPSDWAMAAAAQQQSHQATFVYQISPETTMHPFDAFQSSLLIAAHYNHFDNPTPYLASPAIDHLLNSSPVISHQLLTAKLLRFVPVRALLAISGESWILSEKVPSAQIFSNYKATLKLWAAGFETQCQPMREALKLAIEILQHAVTTPAPALRLELGADMGLYFAVLTIWAATVAATTRVNASQVPIQPHHYQTHSPLLPTNYPSTQAYFSRSPRGSTPSPGNSATLGLLTSHPTSSPSSPSTTSMQSSEVAIVCGNFLSTAKMELKELDLLEVVAQWPHDIAQWQQGCMALMRWVKMRLRNGVAEGRDSVIGSALHIGLTGTGGGGDGFGELLDGVIGVLEKIMSRGWEGWGF